MERGRRERENGREKDSRESEREKRKEGQRRKELRKRGREGEITRKGGEGKGRRYTNHDTRAQVIYGVIVCCLQEKTIRTMVKIRNGFVITTLPILQAEIHVQLVDGYVVH